MDAIVSQCEAPDGDVEEREAIRDGFCTRLREHDDEVSVAEVPRA